MKLPEQGELEFSVLAGGGRERGLRARWSRRLGQYFARQEEAYREFLAAMLPRPGLVVGVAVVVFALSLLIVPYLGSESDAAGG